MNNHSRKTAANPSPGNSDSDPGVETDVETSVKTNAADTKNVEKKAKKTDAEKVETKNPLTDGDADPSSQNDLA